jgi:uncharacterized protein
MRKSTTSFLFPDLNVWLSLSHQAHVHHRVAVAWFELLADSDRLCFCRITQIGLLRLLTAKAIMNAEVLTPRQAWDVYDRWSEDDRIVFVHERTTREPLFRLSSRTNRSSAQYWTDSYLIAFAPTAGFQLATFDRGIRERAVGAALLGDEWLVAAAPVFDQICRSRQCGRLGESRRAIISLSRVYSRPVRDG